MARDSISTRDTWRFVDRFLYRPRLYDRISLALLVGAGLGFMMLIGAMAYLIGRHGDPRQHLVLGTGVWNYGGYLTRLFWLPFVLLEASIAIGILTNPASIMLRELMRGIESGLLGEVRVSAVRPTEIADAIVAKTLRFTVGAWLLYAGAIMVGGLFYLLGEYNEGLVQSRLYREIVYPRESQMIQLAALAMAPLAIALPLCAYFTYLSLRLRLSNFSYFAYFPKLVLNIPLRVAFFYTFGIAAGIAFFDAPVYLHTDWSSLMPNYITINWKFLVTAQCLGLILILLYTILERRQAINNLERLEL